MILLAGGEKSGSGKMTIACNLAIWSVMNQLDTLIIDADPQASACLFSISERLPPTLNQRAFAMLEGLYSTSQSMAERFSMVIIDTGGRDNEELRILTISQRLIDQIMERLKSVLPSVTRH